MIKIEARIENGSPTVVVTGCPMALNESIRTAFFVSSDNSWRMPYGEMFSLRRALSRFHYSLRDGLSSQLSDGDELLNSLRSQELRDDYAHKTKPFAHQVEGFYYGMACPNFLLADEQGLGKTKQAIDLAVNRGLTYGIKRCLIICGVSSLRFNWQSEVGVHSDCSAHILGQRAIARGKNAGKVRLRGNKEKLEDAIRVAEDDPSMPFFIITNIESIRGTSEKYVAPNGKKKTRVVPSPIAEALAKACAEGNIGMIVLDEFHRCKDPTTLQGQAILSLDAPYKMAMTGTPILNTPLDLYTALVWLGVERHNFYAFRNHYCYVCNGQVTGYKNQEELRRGLIGHMLRRRKQDVLDLPEKVYIDEVLEMPEQQQRVYDAIHDETEDALVDVPPTFNPLTMMIRLRQATGFPGIVSDSVTESVKLDRMCEIVDDCVSNGKKCVVFSNWTSVTDEAFRRLSRFNPARYTGELKDYEAEAEKDRFMKDPSCKVMVGTIAKMGTGLTLTAATTCVFLDEPWNRGTKEQCEDRVHRIGTTEPINIITLMCKDTIDQRVNDIVYSKGAIADYFVDGKVDRGGAKQVARFLLS